MRKRCLKAGGIIYVVKVKPASFDWSDRISVVGTSDHAQPGTSEFILCEHRRDLCFFYALNLSRANLFLLHSYNLKRYDDKNRWFSCGRWLWSTSVDGVVPNDGSCYSRYFSYWSHHCNSGRCVGSSQIHAAFSTGFDHRYSLYCYLYRPIFMLFWSIYWQHCQRYRGYHHRHQLGEPVIILPFTQYFSLKQDVRFSIWYNKYSTTSKEVQIGLV